MAFNLGFLLQQPYLEHARCRCLDANNAKHHGAQSDVRQELRSHKNTASRFHCLVEGKPWHNGLVGSSLAQARPISDVNLLTLVL